MNRRQFLTWGALVLTLVATWWASTLDVEEAADRAPSETRAAQVRPARSTASAPLDIAMLEAPRPQFAERAPAVFGVPPPQPLRAVQPRVTARPPARAPALPYTYIGSLREAGGKRTLFLLEDQQLVTARIGQVLDGRYRVDAVDENAVTLTYLPLNEKQRINLTNAR